LEESFLAEREGEDEFERQKEMGGLKRASSGDSSKK
jgi:hypothetical protein